jgi:hypothetical protein
VAYAPAPREAPLGTQSEREVRRRLPVLAHAQTTGNVSKTCCFLWIFPGYVLRVKEGSWVRQRESPGSSQARAEAADAQPVSARTREGGPPPPARLPIRNPANCLISRALPAPQSLTLGRGRDAAVPLVRSAPQKHTDPIRGFLAPLRKADLWAPRGDRREVHRPRGTGRHEGSTVPVHRDR